MKIELTEDQLDLIKEIIRHEKNRRIDRLYRNTTPVTRHQLLEIEELEKAVKDYK